MIEALLAAAALAAIGTGQPPGLAVVEDLRLETVASRGAVGLVVPDAGPRTSEARALASLRCGEVVNSLRGRPPTCDRPFPPVPVLLDLPDGGDQPNDRRYPIFRAGERGLLTSDSTRIPGLVSIADVADDRLEVVPHDDPVGHLERVDERIRENGEVRMPAFLLAALLLGLLALVRPRAAVAGFVAVLAANLVLGAAGVSALWPVLAVVAAAAASGILLARLPLVPLAIALVGAYLVVLAAAGTWVSLSPFGPSQNARFYGLSNLLETLLLVPAFVAAATRATFVPAAVLAVVTVAGSSFGADGGGAIVLVAGYAVLAWSLYRWAGAAAIAAVAGAAALAILVGPETHVTQSAGAGSLADRVALSWERVTDDWRVGLVTLLALSALAVLVERGSRRALPMAMAIAIAASMIVNDSPLQVALGGLVGYLALDRYDSAR